MSQIPLQQNSIITKFPMAQVVLRNYHNYTLSMLYIYLFKENIETYMKKRNRKVSQRYYPQGLKFCFQGFT